LAAAVRAALTDDLSSALTCRTSARDGEKALLIGELSAPPASLARDYARSFFRAGAIANFAVFLPRKLDFGRHTRRGFFESKRHVIPKIGAALLATAAASSPSREQILEAEEVAENVVEIAESGVVEVHIAACPGKPGVAVRVVDFSLLLVA
jgi:hypothetical protein